MRCRLSGADNSAADLRRDIATKLVIRVHFLVVSMTVELASPVHLGLTHWLQLA